MDVFNAFFKWEKCYQIAQSISLLYFPITPLESLSIIIYHPDENALSKLIASLQMQSYDNGLILPTPEIIECVIHMFGNTDLRHIC